MQRIELQPAYILHQRAYRDTSAIVDLITPEFGRMSVLAKGSKRPKSRFQGLLRAFQPMLVSCVGRGELMTLTQVDIPGQHLQIPASCLSSGLYIMNSLYDCYKNLNHKLNYLTIMISQLDGFVVYPVMMLGVSGRCKLV